MKPQNHSFFSQFIYIKKIVSWIILPNNKIERKKKQHTQIHFLNIQIYFDFILFDDIAANIEMEKEHLSNKLMKQMQKQVKMS